jgi:hypothetical protein
MPMGSLVILVTLQQQRMPVQVQKPDLSICYRSRSGDHHFDLHSIDSSLRLIYRQRERDVPSAEGTSERHGTAGHP